jgi:hypothetical protein
MSGLLQSIQHASFSNLGALYLWPGHFARVNPLIYLGLVVAGAFWIVCVATMAWRLLRQRREWLAALTLFIGVGVYVTFVYPPTTDEPHYLQIAESLVMDGDLELSNQYTSGAHLKFFPDAALDPHTVVTPEGEMFSQHTAGLPLLILPGYALAGRWGVLLILCAVAASLPGLLERVAIGAGANPSTARTMAILTASTCPVLFASGLVFTEVPAAVLCAQGLVVAGTGWGAPLCAAALPWLHPRYVLLAAGLFALDLARSRTRATTVLRWAVLSVLSGGIFLSVYLGPALTAVLNVLAERYPAPLASLTAGGLIGNVSLANLPVALAGKLFDRDFGLLPFAPWMLVLFAGILSAGRHGRGALLLATPYFVATLLFRNWGGSAFPGRTMLPLLPFLAPALAAGIGRANRAPWRKMVFGTLVVISLGQAWMLTACPVLRYTSGRTWLASRAGSAVDLLPFNWWPSFSGGTGSAR